MSNVNEKSETCCGGPAPSEIQACCVADANAKASGEHGCGCTDPQKVIPKSTQNSACCG